MSEEKGENVNKCLLSGRFVEDPKILRSKNGNTYTRFTLAVNDRVYSKQDGKWIDKASFFSCMAYGDIATEIVSKGSKGAKVSIIARADQTSYRKDANSPVKKEIVFTVSEFEIEQKQRKWSSSNWI